ncbi:MAG: ATP-binding cassette domain-containing protein [Deltaproteobacteria bacterium]|nr:ATP-binding cassette domain-containing protein [Deltaproteobacteria bacterium]MCB9785759.1 ATP-binding cassette domain-containing protein [Deltaproteobacteria bacterium]
MRRQPLRRMAGLLRPYLGRWILATLLLLGGGALNLLLPQGVRLALDQAVARGDLAYLDRLVALAMVVFTLLGAFVMVRHVLMTWLGERVVADLRERSFRRLLEHPPGFFHEHRSGELLSRLTADIGMLQHAVGTEISIALRSTLTIVGGVALLVMTSPSLTLVMLATLPPVTVGAVWVGRRIRGRARHIQDVMAHANAGLEEAVTGIETVQVFTAEAREAERYAGSVGEVFSTAVRLAYARGAFMGAVQIAGYAALALILWLGARRVVAQTLSAGELAAFLLYAIMVSGAMGSLADVWSNLQRAVGATGRVFALMEEEPAIRDSPDARPLGQVRGELEFDDVTFTYPARPGVPVLRGVSFRIAPGERVALVGRSGAGKSTIAALVHRFWDPDEGTVRLDGRALPTLHLAELRGALATVHQDPIVFSGTIAENIAYGAPEASVADIERAASDALISDFIASLPDGLATEVGERGVRVSGGQRQRIAIARALLADPRLLILDEATSHLDTTNEALVHAALLRLMEGRTTLIIAHRLSTVRNADRILVLEHGAIVEVGDHETLAARGGIYTELLSDQATLLET